MNNLYSEGHEKVTSKKILTILLLSIFFISFASATCTVTLDQDSYPDGGTATATMLCTEHPAESTEAYTLNWTNATGYQLELDTGTTPKADGTNSFFETYVIPSNYFAVYGAGLNATLTGTELEGTDNATIAAVASTDLIITDVTLTGNYRVGRYGSVKFKVTENGGDPVFNARCVVDVVDGNGLPVVATGFMVPTQSNGYVLQTTPIHSFWPEGGNFKWDIACGCLNTTGMTSSEPGKCINAADGTAISGFAKGKVQVPFTLSTWLTSTTHVDKTDYAMKNEIFICANVTNVDYALRIPLEIEYQIRCSAGTDNDWDLDRILLTHEDYADKRGISTNSTQMQCDKVTIPEQNYLQGKTSECYASTNVWMVDSDGSRLIGYPSTSSTFNITSTELNLDADWVKTGTNQINSIVNLSSFTEINGTGTGNIDVRLHGGYNEIDLTHGIELFNLIENITVYNTTGILTEGTHYTLEFLEDDNVEIELKNVPLTNTGTEWWNITLDFYNFEDRQADALEGIENKTGTFHLDVACPSSGTIGSDMSCVITAYIEDSQTPQKEVDFTCHISDGISTYSSVNFNQMITNNALSMSRAFTIPSTFTDGQQYVLQCYADYYNLGSRRDSFYDTFTATTSSGITGSSSGITPGGGTPMTGGVVDIDGDGIPDDEEGIQFGPITLPKNTYFYFIIGIVLLALGVFIYLLIKNHNKEKHYYCPKKDINWKKIFQRAGIILALVLIVLIIGVALFYGCNFLYSYFNKVQLSPQENVSIAPDSTNVIAGYSLIQDNLFRGIILAVVIILLVILFLKALNVRGEIRFGDNSNIKRYDSGVSRLQNKINKEVLRDELKRMKHNK